MTPKFKLFTFHFPTPCTTSGHSVVPRPESTCFAKNLWPYRRRSAQKWPLHAVRIGWFSWKALCTVFILGPSACSKRRSMATWATFGSSAAHTLFWRKIPRVIFGLSPIWVEVPYDTGCYTVNLCRTILGEPEEVFAWGHFGRYGVDEQVGGLLRFGGGRLALIDCSLALPPRQEWEIVGTEGRLSVTNAFLPGTRDTEIQLTHGAECTSISIPGTDQYQRMVEHFGDVTASQTILRLPPEDAVHNLRVIGALHRSLRSGKPESVDR